VQLSQITFAFKNKFSVIHGLQDRFEQTLFKVDQNQPLTPKNIPTKISKLASEIQQDRTTMLKVAESLINDITDIVLHERGHGLFNVYRQNVLGLNLSDTVFTDDQQSLVIGQLLYFAGSLTKKELHEGFIFETPESIQKKADKIFQFGMKFLHKENKKNVLILYYLAFIEEVFIRIVLFDQEGNAIDDIIKKIRRELFMDTDMVHGYGFSFRIDPDILTFLKLHGVERTVDHLMSLYSQEACLALCEVRMYDLWQEITDDA